MASLFSAHLARLCRRSLLLGRKDSIVVAEALLKGRTPAVSAGCPVSVAPEGRYANCIASLRGGTSGSCLGRGITYCLYPRVQVNEVDVAHN